MIELCKNNMKTLGYIWLHHNDTSGDLLRSLLYTIFGMESIAKLSQAAVFTKLPLPSTLDYTTRNKSNVDYNLPIRLLAYLQRMLTNLA